jgi:hypothetical protein
MRRDDNVFLFTLIDFLVQILFFGLAFYTVIAFANAKPNTSDTLKIDRDKVRTVTNWTWSTSIPGLADTIGPLSKPKDDFANWAQFISSHDLSEVTLDFDLVKQLGGKDRVEKAVRALGKPSCLPQDVPRNTATPIADLRLTDDRIAVQTTTPDFLKIAKQVRTDASVGTSFSLANFRAAFQSITNIQPECRYFVAIHEDTRLVAPRNAVNSAFMTILRR